MKLINMFITITLIAIILILVQIGHVVEGAILAFAVYKLLKQENTKEV